MPAKPYPTDVIEQAQSVMNAWKQIDAALTLGNMNVETFTTQIAQTADTASQINSLETQLTNLRNQRDTQMADLWDKVKRVRTGVKSFYGDDSSQYEMIGGTRASERKAPVRKAKAG